MNIKNTLITLFSLAFRTDDGETHKHVLIPGDNEVPVTLEQLEQGMKRNIGLAAHVRGGSLIVEGLTAPAQIETKAPRSERKAKADAALAAAKAMNGKAGDPPPPAGKPEDTHGFTKFTTEEAKELIAAEDDVEVLKQWLAVDERKGVQKLLTDRIAALTPAPVAGA